MGSVGSDAIATFSMAMRPQAPQVAVPQEIQARALSQSVASVAMTFAEGLN